MSHLFGRNTFNNKVYSSSGLINCMEQRALLEKLMVVLIKNKSPTSYGNLRFSIMFTKERYWTLF
jgi:hypothetical protein